MTFLRSSKAILRATFSLPQVLLLTCLFMATVNCAASESKTAPPAVKAAKTIYLDNETGDQAVLDAAMDAFSKWGRFTISNEKDGADLFAVFTHKDGLDKFGNVGFTEMDIFEKGKSDSDLQFKSALHLLSDRQHRTKACVAQFKKMLERKS